MKAAGYSYARLDTCGSQLPGMPWFYDWFQVILRRRHDDHLVISAHDQDRLARERELAGDRSALSEDGRRSQVLSKFNDIPGIILSRDANGYRVMDVATGDTWRYIGAFSDPWEAMLVQGFVEFAPCLDKEEES